MKKKIAMSLRKRIHHDQNRPRVSTMPLPRIQPMKIEAAPPGVPKKCATPKKN